MGRLFRALFLTAFFASPLLALADTDVQDVDDPTYLDGYVGAGAAIVPQLTSQEKGTRQNFRLEFARLRKWISIDARVGIGQNYTDYGALFRGYKHWKFDGESSTGISLGVGLGGMYSQGTTPAPGLNREAFVDGIAAPFIRYIYDFRNGVGLGIDLEYQLVPFTMFTAKKDSDNVEDIRDLRQRIFLGVSILFEVDD